MRLLLALMLSLLLTGCYTQTSVKQMIDDTQTYQVPYSAPTDKAIVYVVRPNSLYGIFKYPIYLDGKEQANQVGYTRGNQYIYFYVSPGKHTIGSKAENLSEVTIDVQAGETAYVIQEGTFGFLFGRNYASKLNPVEGRYYIKHTSLGTINK